MSNSMISQLKTIIISSILSLLLFLITLHGFPQIYEKIHSWFYCTKSKDEDDENDNKTLSGKSTKDDDDEKTVNFRMNGKNLHYLTKKELKQKIKELRNKGQEQLENRRKTIRELIKKYKTK